MRFNIPLLFILALLAFGHVRADEAPSDGKPEPRKGQILDQTEHHDDGTSTVHYDVRGLITELKDFAGPRLTIDTKSEVGDLDMEERSSESDEPITGDDLVELIQESIDAGNWDEDNNRTIMIRNGSIVVRSDQVVHGQILMLLRGMAQRRATQVKTEVTFWKLDKDQWLAFKRAEASGLASLSKKQIKVLDTLEADSSPVFDRVHCLGFNTQRMVGGSSREYHVKREGEDFVLRTGTVLNVRPTLSADRAKVTSELRLTRTELVNDKPEQPEIAQIYFSGTLSAPLGESRVVTTSMDKGAVILVIVRSTVVID